MCKVKSIKIDKNIIWRKIAKKTVILNNKNSNRYILNGIGMILWDYIADYKSLHEAIDAISKEYSVSKNRICHDVDLFIQNLEKEGIISVTLAEYHA